MIEQLKKCNHVDGEWWVNNALAAYKEEIDLATAEHIIDWLESDAAPKRIKRLSVKDAIRLSKEWTKRLKKKGQDIVETEEDVEVVLKVGKFRVVKLLTKRAYEREGNLMAHCVGSYHNKKCDVYSFRDHKNKPHATIEVNTGIDQIKGKGNGCIHPKYIEGILKFVEYLGKDIRSTELRYLGYEEKAKEVWEELDTNWTGVKELTYKGKRYFYMPSGPNLKRKNNE